MDLHLTIDNQTASLLSDMAQKRSLGLEQYVHEFLLEALEQEREDAADFACLAKRDIPGAERVSNEEVWG